MASNFKECPTGVLIEFVGDTTASNYPHCNEKEESLNGKAHKVESSHEQKETSGCQTPIVKYCSNVSKDCLGDELTRKDERETLDGWRTPSPTTMDMINEEALRIVDQLHTSLEISLWDEEFPLSLEEGFSEEYYEYEANNRAFNSLKCNNLSCNMNVIKRDIENELAAKCLSTSKGDVSLIEENIITKETCSLGNPSVVAVNFNVTETSSCVNKNAGSFGSSKESSGDAHECSGIVERSFGAAEANSGIYKKSSSMFNESFSTSKKRYCVKKSSFGSTEGNSDMLEENFNPIEENFNPIEENFNPIEENSDTLEGNSSTLAENSCTLEEDSSTLEGDFNSLVRSSSSLEGNSDTFEGNSDTLEENSGKCGATAKYNANASEAISCDKAGTEQICDLIEESCLVIKENSFITKENFTVKEEIKAVAVVNSSMITKCFNAGDSNSITDMKQRHLSSESIINENCIKSTPSKSLNMKSKVGKVLKGSALKTPINHNKAKENIFQASKDKNALSEKRISRNGPYSSAKSILGESNVNGSEILTNKPNIKTPLSKRILGKITFGRGENKPNMNLSQDQTVKKSNTPMNSMNSVQYTAASTTKMPLFKSNSVMDTPNFVKPIRRSNSFQTRTSIGNPNQVKREKSFVAVSHLKTLNSRMSFHQTPRIGSELKTPLKSSFLPKHPSNTFATTLSSNAKSCAKASQIACPSFGSALKQINTPTPVAKEIFGFKRPASTTSKTRFASRLELPSPLPKEINDSIPRRLFPDNTPKKRFN